MLSPTNTTFAINSPPLPYSISSVGSYVLLQTSKILEGLSLQKDHGVTWHLESHCSLGHLSTQATQK
jgi:hypothetical protein